MTGKRSKHYHAAIMGDLVRSERTQSIEHLHTLFNASVEHQNKLHKSILLSPLTITLGDEFQGLTSSLSSTLSIMRDLRYELMSQNIECRFSIGLVELKTPLNTRKAWNMMGLGLARTREKLNEKRATSLYRFAIFDDILSEITLEALGTGLTAIERRWTDQQRDDITALLAGASAAEIAKRRNVSVHSIYKVRGSGDFDAYIVQWHAIQEMLAHLDKIHEMV